MISTARSTRQKRMGRGLAAHEARVGLLMALPAMIFFTVFLAYPFVNAFWVSLTSWDLVSPPKFVGMRNYVRLMSDSNFINSVKVTVFYAVGLLVPLIPASLGLAVLLDRNLRGRGIYQGVLFAPVVLSMVVVSMIWRVVFMPQGGLMQLFTAPLGFPSLPWLNDQHLALPALIMVGFWKDVGYYMVIFLAGLQAISPVYYEAAKVDGASAWHQFRYITLPLLRPVLLFVAVVSMIKAFQAFSSAYTLTGGGPADATKVLPILVYQNAFFFNKMGYASAMAVLMFVVLLILTLLQFRFLRPEV
jgi:multiple sugar transport system permease protein